MPLQMSGYQTIAAVGFDEVVCATSGKYIINSRLSSHQATCPPLEEADQRVA
jgi:hypothetical protein